jgi:uncharacterized protein with GYD domain
LATGLTNAYEKSRKPPERAEAAHDMAKKAGGKMQLFHTMGNNAFYFANITERGKG